MDIKPSLSLSEFSKLSRQGNVIPLFIEIPSDLETPVSAFMKIMKGKYGFLLESVEGGEKWGRYSFLGANPRLVFKSQGSRAWVTRDGKKEEIAIEQDPLASLEDLTRHYRPVKVDGLPPFFGGMVGYLSYDLVRFFEKLPDTSKNDQKLPETYLMFPDTVVVFDNLRQVIQLITTVFLEDYKTVKTAYQAGIKKLKLTCAALKKPLPPSKSVFKSIDSKKIPDNLPLKARRSEAEFCALVEKAKEYIKAGDIFQVQVSTRFEGKTSVPPFELYRAVRRLTPTPYLYYLHFPDMALVGASPELLVKLEGDVAAVRPIAGTRRRGRTVPEDALMEQELKSDPKEKAEHLMLVDLGRNDLGRVCETASISVDELEVIEKYSHVMHMVSHVSGILKPGLTPYDLIRATFPAGTLTGAPKIRAMEIIEELESIRRGVYGGAVGYIGLTGNVDLAIAIRTAVYTGNKICVQSAGGIVYDSIPKLEYKELHNKARAMRSALASCRS